MLGGALTPDTCEVVLQAHAAGHEIGNHTQNHYGLNEAPPETIEAEITETHVRLSELLPAPPRLIRPHYGRGSEAVDRCAAHLGYEATVLWNICPSDWEMAPAATIASRVLAGENPFHDEIANRCGHTPKASLRGAIVLLHDGYGPKRQGESRLQTVEALRQLVPELLSRGFHLVTVSELLAGEELPQGFRQVREMPS